MSAPPAIRRETESQFQAAVMALARTLHWQCFHVHDSRRSIGRGVLVGDRDAAGIPDLILARERVVWAELKPPRGKLRPAQERWRDALLAAGQEWYCWRPADFDSGLVLDVLARRAAG